MKIQQMPNGEIQVTFRPDEIGAPTNYGNLPNSPSVQLGEFGSAPSQYNNQFTPNGTTYLEQIDSPDFIGIQSSSFSGSGLSTDTSNAAPTTYIAPLIDNITTYPEENVTGIIGGAPQQFNQLWGENKPYYNYMKTNFEAQ
jgi:hypothetical protein